MKSLGCPNMLKGVIKSKKNKYLKGKIIHGLILMSLSWKFGGYFFYHFWWADNHKVYIVQMLLNLNEFSRLIFDIDIRIS